MEALLLRDAAYVSERYEELQDSKRQLVQSNVAASTAASCAASTGSEASTDWLEQEHSRILQRAKTLEAKGPTPQLKKKMFVLEDVLRRLYAKDELDRHVISPPNGALKRQEPFDANCPVPLKELPQPTQVVLRMFFRMCRSLREPTKLAANYRLSVQIASKLPTILTTMPACVLSPGLADEASAELEDAGVCNVFYQLFQLFEELLGLSRMENVGGKSTSAAGVGLSGGDRATVIVSYVALSLKWGRLGYLLKGVKLLLENTNELSETRFEPLLLLLRELAATQIERPQIAFGEEEQLCGYLMSFGKGDHGKLGHGQCAHVGCQEGNCTENKMAPTLIAATRDVVFRKIDSLSTHSIAITANGEAMAWGNGDKYRLGHGSSAKEYTPRTIEFLSLKGQVCDLACGLGHTLALMESGELFAWGNGSNGRLGLGDANDRSSPTKVAIPTSSGKQEAGEKEVSSDPASASSTSSVRFRHIYCGASHSLGLSWDGRAYAWGKNNQGQCGHGHTNDQWTIQEIESFRGTEEGEEDECVTYAAGGWEHTLFCTASGRVYSCGCGYKDSRRTGIPPVLGHGDCDRRLKPTLLQTLDDSREEIVKVACGWDHSLAVSASGRVYTWGSGTNGKLGHGDEESFDIPTLVRTMEGKRVKDAKAGCEHTVFLTDDHELWTCGQGDSGRLGHGDSQTRKRPTKIELFAKSGLKPVALAVGDKYNLVLVTDDSSQGAHGNEHGSGSVSKVAYRVNEHGSGHGTNVHHGRHRSALHKKQIDNQQTQFGANWVLGIAAGSEPEGTPATRAANALKDGFTPDSARAVALFIAGHMDRLASDYVAEEPEPTSEKRHEPNVIETHSKMQSVLLPFAIDTSCESLNALHRLLRWVTMSTKTKDKSILAEKYGPDDLSVLATQERMGLALSCLRILQINLTNALRTPHVPGESACGTESHSKLGIDLFSRIHELLDSLAGLKEADLVYRFDDGVRQAGGANKLSAAAKAISQEAASALKVRQSLCMPHCRTCANFGFLSVRWDFVCSTPQSFHDAACSGRYWTIAKLIARQ
jgi:alpha-tubulin suppressor-like RCC1 family protein